MLHFEVWGQAVDSNYLTVGALVGEQVAGAERDSGGYRGRGTVGAAGRGATVVITVTHSGGVSWTSRHRGSRRRRCRGRRHRAVVGHLHQLVHAGVEALTLGASVNGLLLVDLSAVAGIQAAVLGQQALDLGVILK